MIEKSKDSQAQSLAELQQELKSLKTLLLSRGPGLSSTPQAPLPTLPTRPSIPAWQLAGDTVNGSPAGNPSSLSDFLPSERGPNDVSMQ
jgi:peroxin-14